MAKGKVIDGKLLCFAALARAMELRGHPITRVSLHEFFMGKKDPRLRTFVVMAEALGMTLDQAYDLLLRVRRGEYYEVGF